MTIRRLLTVAILITAGANALALSPQHETWGKSAVSYLFTEQEAAAWKAIKSDSDADAFVALFWARRDPTPDTPRNEARELFEQRVAWADENLKQGKSRGSMTDRGKAFILYGQPKRMERSPVAAPRMSTTSNDMVDTSSWVQWVYEGDDAKNFFGTPRATIRFVDQMGNQEFRVDRGGVDLTSAQKRAVARMIVSPNLTAPRTFATTAAPAPVAAAPAPVPVAATPLAVNPLSTAALSTAVSEFKAATANPYENKAFATWGEYVTPLGEYYVPVMLYVPKSSGITPEENVTFFGVIEDESGKSVLTFEQPARLHTAKDDYFVDRSLALPAGKHRGIFGIARNGQPLAIASTNMTLAGSLDKDASAVTQLILANYIAASQTATEPTEAFSFGGVKVVPKADKVFKTSDELWFFFSVRNPGLAEMAATEGSATGAPAEAKPKIQMKMEVEGKGTDGKPLPKKTAPPREVDAIAMKGVPGHYGIGNAIPLESFKPGDYTLTLKVMDTVKKTSYTLTDSFKVVQ